MTSSAVSKKPAQQVNQSGGSGALEESHEQSSKASASAGLNLNVVGALAGAFSSKSSKETADDGSSLETEEKHAGVKGAGAGNLNAAAAANAEKDKKSRRQIEE